MSKFLKILMAIGLIVAIATPALAQFKLGGYFRTQMYSLERKNTSDSDGSSQQFVDQRLRMRLQYTFNENVSAVYYGEVDNVWGAGGGALGADAVNLQSKQAFVNFKWADCNVRLGTQGMADKYLGLIYNWDMTGIAATHNYGPTSVSAAYSKWDEGDRGQWDDRDFYVLSLDHKFGDALTLGGSVYYEDNNDFGGGDFENMIFGLNGDYRFGLFGINGFVLYQDGSTEFDGSSDEDYSAYAASVKGNMKLGNGEIGLRYLYISDDDDEDDAGEWRGVIGAYSLVSEGMMIFTYDPYYMNSGAEAYALGDAAQAGFGLHAIMLNGDHKLPQNMYFRWGVGYFAAATDDLNDDGSDEVEGKTLGFEVSARVGKKFFEKVELSLNAAYASFGDFYDNTAGGDDPDSIYKSYLMVNVPF